MVDRNRGRDADTYEDQMTTNLVAIIASLLMLLGGFWLLTSIDRALKSERCLVHIEELYRVDLVARGCRAAFADDYADGFRGGVEIAGE